MRERIQQALEDAMRTTDTVCICTLRLMLAAIRDREDALGVEDDAGGLDDAEINQLLTRMVKQREESAETYAQAGRLELAQREEQEIRIIREFMPKPMSDAELRSAVDDAIGETGADSIRDIGRVMGHLKARYPGRMDFGAAGARVKRALS